MANRAELHLFPAIPVSVAVEVGQCGCRASPTCPAVFTTRIGQLVDLHFRWRSNDSPTLLNDNRILILRRDFAKHCRRARHPTASTRKVLSNATPQSATGLKQVNILAPSASRRSMSKVRFVWDPWSARSAKAAMPTTTLTSLANWVIDAGYPAPSRSSTWLAIDSRTMATIARCWSQRGGAAGHRSYSEQDGVGFHLDTLPCVPNPIVSERVSPKYGNRAIGITDLVENDKQYHWGHSNPNGFADWFIDRQRAAFNRIAALRKQELVRRNPTVFASVADVPDQLVRTPLQRAVQILKRHRDVRFSGIPMKTTSQSRSSSRHLLLSRMSRKVIFSIRVGKHLGQDPTIPGHEVIRCVDGKWFIENPTNPGENFADRWNDDGSQRADAFFEWLDWVREDLDDLLNAASESELEPARLWSHCDAPGKRVASAYRGPLPGAYQPATSLFSRVGRALLRFDVSHRQTPRWHLQPTRYWQLC